MNATKIAGLVGLLLAVAAAFVDVPYVGAALVLIGLFVGWAIAAEDHVRVIVSAIAVASLSGVLREIPQAGDYLATIYAGIGQLTAGAALMIVSCNIYKRFKP